MFGFVSNPVACLRRAFWLRFGRQTEFGLDLKSNGTNERGALSSDFDLIFNAVLYFLAVRSAK